MPAFLISQKSKIFDSFPPGEAFVKLKFDILTIGLRLVADHAYQLLDKTPNRRFQPFIV